jgi:hypothetical protein
LTSTWFCGFSCRDSLVLRVLGVKLENEAGFEQAERIRGFGDHWDPMGMGGRGLPLSVCLSFCHPSLIYPPHLSSILCLSCIDYLSYIYDLSSIYNLSCIYQSSISQSINYHLSINHPSSKAAICNPVSSSSMPNMGGSHPSEISHRSQRWELNLCLQFANP